MKKLALIIVGFLSCLTSAAAADSWYNPVPDDLRNSKKIIDIPRTQYFEVSASREDTAEYWLSKKMVLPQKSNDLEFFGQRSFKCPSATKPYLVRAVYENGGTGEFYVQSIGSVLIISHASLGGASKMYRSALVVCLAFEPTEVFHALSSAM